ncbi:MAG: hypothetical protein EHM62_06285 [Methylococcus sp.]|nr:MAG: hypothetical protein EHM62_06285 [Methylococcus sp.]
MPAGVTADLGVSAPGSWPAISRGQQPGKAGGNAGAPAPVQRHPARRGAPRTSRTRPALLNLVLTLALALPSALIHAESRHLLQAIEHTRAAIQAGNADNLPALLELATLAHRAADASDEAEHNVMVENGEIMLEKAVTKARDQKILVSVVYARDALINLERAAAALGLPVSPPASSSSTRPANPSTPPGTPNPR